jgi:hypothetical protein
MSVACSDDSAVALVTLEARFGPWDIFLFELRDGKVVRSTNLLNKSRWPTARASATTRFLACGGQRIWIL